MRPPITTSLFSLFKLGPGPSSSHTMAPMRAGKRFREELEKEIWPDKSHLSVHLYGSLSATGRGHFTDQAVLAGLLGYDLSDCPSELLFSLAQTPTKKHPLGICELSISLQDIIHDAIEHSYPYSNTMELRLLDATNNCLLSKIYYSIGGGFLLAEGENLAESGKPAHPYSSMKELKRIVDEKGLTLYEIILDNEEALTGISRPKIIMELNELIQRMDESVIEGLEQDGELPGKLHVKRKAGMLYDRAVNLFPGPERFISLLCSYAFAAAEQNAAGGIVVTAPTCGSAGVLPSIIHLLRHDAFVGDRAILEGLLAAAAVGFIAKHNASISGAEVGCQGEIGVASSMAAAMLAETRGNPFHYIENAAEISLEHHLGLTCDPVAGYVQIPCIERNAMGAAKAFVASTIATAIDPQTQRVSLDSAIAAMAETGREMSHKFKETSLGGLAVSTVAC